MLWVRGKSNTTELVGTKSIDTKLRAIKDGVAPINDKFEMKTQMEYDGDSKVFK